MKKVKYCKIVQDLLPTYIENLTDSETNKFIENHIRDCTECENVLKDMNSELGETNLQRIYQEREIDYLKKIKRKNIILMSIAIIAVSILGFFIYKYFSYTGFRINDNGKIDFWSPLISERKTLFIKNIDILTTEYTTEFDKKSISNRLIIIFDENDLCIAGKILQTGFDVDRFYDYFNDLKHSENLGIYTNVCKNENSISFNVNIFNNLTREEVKEQIMNRFGVKEFEEW